jgi:hypothetical protein
VLPGDWERVIRPALGTRGRGWIVRAWTHSERALVSTAIWPIAGAGRDPEAEQLADALRSAGPETLLVALGPKDGALDAADLDWARLVVRGVIQRFRKRIPVVRDVVVTRLWPLRWVTPERPAELRLPTFEIDALAGGRLLDAHGRGAPPPHAVLFLNAAIVDVREEVAE